VMSSSKSSWIDSMAPPLGGSRHLGDRGRTGLPLLSSDGRKGERCRVGVRSGVEGLRDNEEVDFAKSKGPGLECARVMTGALTRAAPLERVRRCERE
jgi:hypothetical protein